MQVCSISRESLPNGIGTWIKKFCGVLSQLCQSLAEMCLYGTIDSFECWRHANAPDGRRLAWGVEPSENSESIAYSSLYNGAADAMRASEDNGSRRRKFPSFWQR